MAEIRKKGLRDNILRGEKVVLLRSGTKGWIETERFIYQYSRKIDIKTCIYNNGWIWDQKTFVLVADKYQQIRNELMEAGLKEFEDFADIRAVGRDMVIIHGNCHTIAIKEFLESCAAFREKYYFYDIPLVFENQRGYIEQNILNQCKLFLYQNISTAQYGKMLTDDFLLPLLPKDCVKIAMPNLFHFGNLFLPKMVGNKWNKKVSVNDKHGIFRFIYPFMAELIEKGYDIETVWEASFHAYSEQELQQNYDDCVRKIKNEEEKWDIKILDFIVKEYKKEKLFYDPGHPTYYLFREIACRILTNLQIVYDRERLAHTYASGAQLWEEPTLPCVTKYFQLDYGENEIIRRQSNRKLSDKEMNFKDYVSQLVYWYQYSKDEEKKLEETVEKNRNFLNSQKAENKKVILFGTGSIFQNFMSYYSETDLLTYAVDNDSAKWGTNKNGIRIKAPEAIREIPMDKIVIIICTSYAEEIAKQLTLIVGAEKLYVYSYESLIRPWAEDTDVSLHADSNIEEQENGENL